MAGCFLLLFAGLSLSGCQVAHMALTKDFQSGSSQLTVEGRSLSFISKSFKFGQYDVTDIHRGWTKGSGFSISNDSASKFSVSEERFSTFCKIDLKDKFSFLKKLVIKDSYGI